MSGSKRKRVSDGLNTTTENADANATGSGDTSPHPEENGRPPLLRDTNVFEVKLLKPSAQNPLKRRKFDGDAEFKDELGVPGAENSLAVKLHVVPNNQWTTLTKYRNFVVNPPDGEAPDARYKFQLGDFILVNHQTEISSDQSDNESDSGRQHWVAQVREVRAASSDAVFVRVVWMYWPEELPGGKAAYHGSRELVASNLQDVIDAMTVEGKAKVVNLKQDLKGKGRDTGFFGNLDKNTFYWRQTYNMTTNRLSSLPKDCECRRISNMDERLFMCPNEGCGKWLHESCLQKAVLKTYWNQVHQNGGISRTEAQEKSESTVNDHKASVTPKHESNGGDETEIEDTIVAASPKNSRRAGLLGRLGTLFSGVSNQSSTLNGDGPKKPLALRSKNSKIAKFTKKNNTSKQKKESVSIEKNGDAEPWEGVLRASLILDGRRFTGKAEIYKIRPKDVKIKRNDEDSDFENSDDELVDTVEVFCLNDKCQQSLADEAVEAKLLHGIKNGFDAVKDAIKENASSLV